MSGILRRVINKFSHKDRSVMLEKELKKWKTNFMPPGHYYSPFPDSRELILNKKKIFSRDWATPMPGIDVREKSQLDLLHRLGTYYREDIFPSHKQPGYRYSFDNQYFCFSDAVFLYSMMREFKPKRIIEIGSGFSSAVMLDVNEQYFDGSIDITFIEPAPEDRLESLIKKGDQFTMVKDLVQNVPIQFFSKLGENDFLFVDSSHVSKAGSDVNHILFNILPALNKGVIIHFHDIFFPFEYPFEWIAEQQRGWNEAYLLRAFLQYNNSFSIELFTSYLEGKYRDWFSDNMPICLKPHEEWAHPDGSIFYLDTSGQSIYLRKTT